MPCLYFEALSRSVEGFQDYSGVRSLRLLKQDEGLFGVLCPLPFLVC